MLLCGSGSWGSHAIAYSNVLNINGWCKYIYLHQLQFRQSTKVFDRQRSEELHVCLIAALLRGERHVLYSTAARDGIQ